MLCQKGLNVGLAVQPVASLEFWIDRGNADHLAGEGDQIVSLLINDFVNGVERLRPIHRISPP